IRISANFDQAALVIHSIGSSPKNAKISLLIAPKLSLNKFAKIKIVTNPGTAHGKTRIIRKNILKRRLGWLTITDIKMPIPTCSVETTRVHTTDHPTTSKKVDRQTSTVNNFANVSNPTQSTKLAGGE